MPVRNGMRSLPTLLKSLAQQTLAPERFEVIVVDNDSSDRTAELATAAGVRVLTEPVANRARARNTGARSARGGLFAFTDADCVADPGWLQALLDCSPDASLVAGDVRVRLGSRPNVLERFEALWRFGQESWVHQGWAATANLLVDARAFAAIGGFDPSWRHIGEDVDFCLRARAAGHSLAYCAAAMVEHAAERDLWPFLRRCFLHGYSVNQAFYRLGVGARAWRDPAAALVGDRALREFGHDPGAFDATEWRRMARVARLGHAARITGSAWAEAVRAR